MTDTDKKEKPLKRKFDDEEEAMDVSEPIARKRPALPKTDIRRVFIPANRRTPLKTHWEEIIDLIVNQLKLNIRYNVRRKCVELAKNDLTTDFNALQKGADFIKTFTLGFDLADSIAMLRLDELYLDSFQVTDVKLLKGDHLSRAIARIAGSKGKTKNAIENATTTRIVLSDNNVHILGAFTNVNMAKKAICELILGSPMSAVYGKLRNVVSRSNDRI